MTLKHITTALLTLALVVPTAAAAPAGGPTVGVGDASAPVDEPAWVDVVVTAGDGPVAGIEALRIDADGPAEIVDARLRDGQGDASAFGDHARIYWTADEPVGRETVIAQVLVRGDSAGETTLRITTLDGVERPGDGFYAADRRNGTVTIQPDPNEPRAGPVALTADVPELRVDETATIAVGLNASQGVGVARASISLPPHVDLVETTVPAAMGLVDVDESDDGTTLDVRAIDVEANTIARLRVRGVETGSHALLAFLSMASAEDATLYRPVGGLHESVTVAAAPDPAPPALGADGRAGDPDGDGVYEDTNGDGRVDLRDVRALLQHVDGAPDGFDINGDGTVDLRDARALLEAIG